MHKPYAFLLHVVAVTKRCLATACRERIEHAASEAERMAILETEFVSPPAPYATYGTQ